MRASLMFFEIEMSGAYSDTSTRQVVTLEERDTDLGDAPCYSIIDQSEFTPALAVETLEFI